MGSHLDWESVGKLGDKLGSHLDWVLVGKWEGE